MEDVEGYTYRLLRDIDAFARGTTGITLRSYQRMVAERVLESVRRRLGDTIVVMFPRQSGKNELQAHIECYLLSLYSSMDIEMVKVSPTWKPQTENSMRRLERVLNHSLIIAAWWKKESGYVYRAGSARLYFLSGSPTTSVVGATATHLLECDEAQDVLPEKWDKDFAPMAASRNATRVFWGTAWTSRTLLAREFRLAQEAEKRTGRRCAFRITADEVRLEAPAYGAYVDEQVRRLGRDHPLVRTQFFSEEIDADTGMFPASRRALMQGDHPPRFSPLPSSPTPPASPKGEAGAGGIYALLVDVAGEDEGASEGAAFGLKNPGRDSTTVTVVEVDLAGLLDDVVRAPAYRVVCRYAWTGVRHTSLYSQIKALHAHWGARYLVIDATGVGVGLSSFLASAVSGVIPFVFTQRSKSELGWGFLSVVESGRYKEYAPHPTLGEGKAALFAAGVRGSDAEPYRLQQEFWRQVEHCQLTVLDGPGKAVRWGVPDGTRDAQTGEIVHDDLLLSAALCSVLDSQPWGVGASRVGPADDILGNMRDAY